MNIATASRNYLVDVIAEFKKVTFPSRRDIGIHTLVVVASIIAMIGFLAVVDGGFAVLLKLLLSYGR
ncbi:preprotein translocase subunit SecE [Candidatus Berkelbacteria bacterium]|nr:preprotein translocase subunit SecE [Candidatus Berkelbacteria bacterium]